MQWQSCVGRESEEQTCLYTALVPFAWLAQPEREWNFVGCWWHLFNNRCESDGRHAVPFQHAHRHIHPPHTPPPPAPGAARSTEKTPPSTQRLPQHWLREPGAWLWRFQKNLFGATRTSRPNRERVTLLSEVNSSYCSPTCNVLSYGFALDCQFRPLNCIICDIMNLYTYIPNFSLLLGWCHHVLCLYHGNFIKIKINKKILKKGH